MDKQKEAFEKLSKLKVGALFMEMGTGKTKVALDLIASKKHKISYVLWICPFSIKQEIQSEINKWRKELDIEIIGVETISSSDRIYLNILDKVASNDSFIVVDESLKIKNKDAIRTKRILKLGSKAKYKLILNGTPISKNVLDLYTQMQFLSPKILDMSFNEFKNTYCEYYLRGKLKNLVKKQHNIEHLISKIQPYIFESQLEINSRKHYYSYEYSLENIEEYQAIKDKYLNLYDWQFDFMALSTELQHCYCMSKGKSILLDELIEEINDRVIVFVKFKSSIPCECIAITGDTSEKTRAKILEDFKNDTFKVLYITYGCGSFGLNLQFCKHIIFSEHTFDYAVRDQAEARIYRIGQNYDVNYYDLNCNVGLENLIQSSLEKKSNLLQEIKKEIEIKGAKEWLKSI